MKNLGLPELIWTGATVNSTLLRHETTSLAVTFSIFKFNLTSWDFGHHIGNADSSFQEGALSDLIKTLRPSFPVGRRHGAQRRQCVRAQHNAFAKSFEFNFRWLFSLTGYAESESQTWSDTIPHYCS